MQAKCVIEHCKQKPIYAFNHYQKPIYCIDHREDDTVPIVFVQCKYPRCKETVLYKNSWKNETEAICFSHSTIISEQKKEIHARRCKYENGCRRIAKYAYKEEQNPIWCYDHKDQNAVLVTPKKCRNNFCNKEGKYAYVGMLSRYCEDHAKEDMLFIQPRVINAKKKLHKEIKNLIQNKEEKVCISIELQELFCS